MGFASGSMTFRRFFLSGRHPERLTEDGLAAVAANAHGRRGYDPKQLVESGWIVPEHVFDVDFSSSHRITCGPFVFLGLRVDRLSPPPAVVAGYRKMEERALLVDAEEGATLGRAERRLAKETAERRAQEEARQGAFRRISAYPLLIDLENGVAYFGNLGKTPGEILTQLFADTFDITLVPASTGELTTRWSERTGRTRWLDDALPATLVEPPSDADARTSLTFPGADRSFLGREFLAWLMFRGDAGEGLFEVVGRGGVSIAVHRLMAMSCVFQLSGSMSIRCDAPAESPEGRAALRIGKLPAKLGLLVESGSQAWSLTLDEAGSVSGLVIPPAEDVDDGWALLEHRFLSMREAASTLDGLWGAFLETRLGEDWGAELERMSNWARRSPATESERRRATA